MSIKIRHNSVSEAYATKTAGYPEMKFDTMAQAEAAMLAGQIPNGCKVYIPGAGEYGDYAFQTEIGGVEDEDTAVATHTAGSYFVWKGRFAKAKILINIGDSLSTSNVEYTTIADEMKTIKDSIPQTISATATLTSNGWTTSSGKYVQTINVTGITATTVGTVGISINATNVQRTAASDAKVTLTGQGDGTMTFQADNTPSVDIPIVVNINR